MALSDKRVLMEMERGDIVISPFDRKNLGTCSYDVRLGEYYFREQSSSRADGDHSLYNIYDQSHTESVWGTTPQQAITAEILRTLDKGFSFKGIKEDDLVILIQPHETILAHTEEFIGGRNHITSMMKARSSFGRSFIEICKCAGWGDVGYINRWTMEITNNSQYYCIPLVVGRRIAQIVFFETGPILGADYPEEGKYQHSPALNDLREDWDPKMMLPQLYKDRDISR